MSFLSTFTTDPVRLNIPDWFRDKYQGRVHYGPTGNMPISAIGMFKSHYSDIVEDLHRVVREDEDLPNPEFFQFSLVWLHECGGITLVEISREAIELYEPVQWKAVDEVSHHEGDSCYFGPSKDKPVVGFCADGALSNPETVVNPQIYRIRDLIEQHPNVFGALNGECPYQRAADFLESMIK